jgi:nucleotide-binding universal stress UspA family protein
MRGYSRIVAGIDFTPCSAAALAQAARIAGWSGATIHAVHVIDAQVALELEEALSLLERNVREGLVSDAEAAWRDFAGGVPGTGDLPVEVVIDDRVEGILERAREHKADLLVLGAYGSRPADVGVGTVASGCVRRAGTEVLLVRDTQPGPFRCVIAGVDFSPASRRAVERAALVAERDAADLHVLHVFRGPWHELHYRAPTVEVAPHFQQQYRDGLGRRLAEFCRAAAGGAGVARTRHVVFDHDGHRSGLVEYAAVVSADLIVLGTRGRSSLRDIVLGNTAERTLRDTACSVLAVPPG